MSKKIKCKICGKEIFVNYGKKRNKSGMCINCYRDYCNKLKIEEWLKTGNTGCSVSTTLRSVIRTYILKEQDYKCAICGISNVWNKKPLNFILDHINGDASNNFRYNLRLICSNCDSQLDTYKYKNKNSARTHRKTDNDTK